MRATGTLKTFNLQRGFGFIARPGADDVFVHATQIKKLGALHAGDKLSFEIEMRDRGAAAVDVERVVA